MLTVENDWIQYEAIPARRTAVRGGSSCALRIPVQSAPPARATAPSVAPTPPRARAGGATPSLRLTRRGRFALVVLPGLLALCGALVVLSGTGPAQAAQKASAAPAAERSVQVSHGDSLWAIARRIAPHEDPRAVVRALQRENGLRGSVLRPGQVLQVPASR